MNYQQMMVERRPNRFAFTSVIYPAMLILGLTITKLDNKLAYGVSDQQKQFKIIIIKFNLNTAIIREYNLKKKNELLLNKAFI